MWLMADNGHMQKVPLSELDREATLKSNEDRGVEFPRSAAAVARSALKHHERLRFFFGARTGSASITAKLIFFITGSMRSTMTRTVSPSE